jgi:hypothetical protein
MLLEGIEKAESTRIIVVAVNMCIIIFTHIFRRCKQQKLQPAELKACLAFPQHCDS